MSYDHTAYMREYRARRPDYVDQHAARDRRRQRITERHASAHRAPWTDAEVDALLADRPLVEVALELGRTYTACREKRRTLRPATPAAA